MNFGILTAESSTLPLAVSDGVAAQVNAYEGVTVPAFNIIMEGLSLILLIGAAIAAVLVLRNHVRQWLFPFVIGIIFNLVFQYMLFNQNFGILILLFSYLSQNVDFLRDNIPLCNLILQILQAGFTVLTVFLGLTYWKKSSKKDGRPLSLGGAFAFGLSFYIISLFSSGFLTQLYNMLVNSRMINSSGFDAVLKSYLEEASDFDEQTIAESLLTLAGSDREIFVQYLLQSFIMIFEGIVAIAASVLHYGVISRQTDGKWNIAAVILHVAVYLPSILTFFTGSFPAFIYVSLAFTGVLAAIGVLSVLHVSRTYMPDEWAALGYTRKMQKQDEAREKNKMPKIVMPKD